MLKRGERGKKMNVGSKKKNEERKTRKRREMQREGLGKEETELVSLIVDSVHNLFINLLNLRSNNNKIV